MRDFRVLSLFDIGDLVNITEVTDLDVTIFELLIWLSFFGLNLNRES